jgi:hypothetical protein
MRNPWIGEHVNTKLTAEKNPAKKPTKKANELTKKSTKRRDATDQAR